MASNSVGVERNHLARQVMSFRLHAKKLKKIFKDTVKVLSDLQDFDEALSIDEILAVQAQKCISNVVSGRTALVVFGETRLRVSLANEILGEAILPIPRTQGENWRMVHFKYKKNRVLSHVVDGYDVTHTALQHPQDFLLTRIPRDSICISSSSSSSSSAAATATGQVPPEATLEVGLNNPILEAGFEVICSPSSHPGSLDGIKKTLQVCQVELHPFFIYGLDGRAPLNQQQLNELELLRRQMPDVPMLFVIITQDYMSTRRPSMEQASHNQGVLTHIYGQLCKIRYLKDSTELSVPPSPSAIHPHDNPELNPELTFGFLPVDTIVTNFLDFTAELLGFVQCNMKQEITSAASSLHDAHARCLQTLILYAHDLARDVLVTPKRIKYARTKEEELYTQLIDLASRKQSEIKELVHEAIADCSDDIIQQVVQLNFEDFNLDESLQAPNSKTFKLCTQQIQELVFRELSRQISDRLIHSVNYLRESVVGTLRRCLEKLEGSADDRGMSSSGTHSVAVVSVDGVGDGGDTSRALSQILDTAYNLEFNERTSTSAVRLLVERVKQAFNGSSLKNQKLDQSWREKYSRQLMSSLSGTRLAKSICAQFRSRVTSSHETFLAAIKQLEMRHSGRLKESEGQRDTIRKVLTPKMARLSLSSVALRDSIVHGLPITGRELGRGQYGVVFQCAEWAGKGPLAVKSVVPPDEKHWNDLALEFHYTWTLPKNDRVVNLIGALIDDDYSNGSNAVVLFIMPRFPRDLHAALKVGLDFGSRMQIALDVVEGIRFLHGQGLLHRDIKLKNVLLDSANRGTLTDLGFCKPEAMMTCTIVGTPIHMAPELFGGSYNNAVDIYAFGILFWYICANDTKLPGAFDACQNKEQLWTAVRKGLRPERLPRFDSDCWELMTACWHGDELQRPLIGDVALRLHLIMKRIGRKPLK